MQYSTSTLSPTASKTPGVVTPTVALSSLAKAGLVYVLVFLLTWRPSVAMRLGRLVLRVWPHFRRA